MEASDSNGRPFNNALKLLGEGIVPGASLLFDGKFAQGGAHLLAGAVARAALGPLGVAVVIANSYSSSTTGKNLLNHISNRKGKKKNGSDTSESSGTIEVMDTTKSSP